MEITTPIVVLGGSDEERATIVAQLTASGLDRAIAHHPVFVLRDSLRAHNAAGRATLAALPTLGIDLLAATDELERDGVTKFITPFRGLLGALGEALKKGAAPTRG